MFIPENLDDEELSEYQVMAILGVDKPTLQKLGDYLDEQEQKGIETTYDMISEWMKENG